MLRKPPRPSRHTGETWLVVGATSTPHWAWSVASTQSFTPLPFASGPSSRCNRTAAICSVGTYLAALSRKTRTTWDPAFNQGRELLHSGRGLVGAGVEREPPQRLAVNREGQGEGEVGSASVARAPFDLQLIHIIGWRVDAVFDVAAAILGAGGGPLR